MSKFLSSEWLEQAKEIREEAEGNGTNASPPHKMKMNLVIIDCPEGVGTDGSVDAHMDTTAETMQMDLGHLEGPDLTVTVDYTTAKAIFVENNAQAGMQAFMAGKVKVQGDMTKLMAMQQSVPDAGAMEIAAKIKAITD